MAQRNSKTKIQNTKGSYLYLMLTYPIQAAQILHQVFICRGIIVEYGMLFVHTPWLKCIKENKIRYLKTTWNYYGYFLEQCDYFLSYLFKLYKIYSPTYEKDNL